MEVGFQILGALGSIASLVSLWLVVSRYQFEPMPEPPAAMPAGDEPESRDEG